MRDFNQMLRTGSPFSNGSPTRENEARSANGDYSVSPEAILKHPLENCWTLWYFKNDRSKGWEENQKEVMSFSTVEDFWSVYNHIEQVSKLGTGCDYSFFKTGIKPMWEDEANKFGGRWIINIEKWQKAAGIIDKIWLDILLCLIGESFEDSGRMVNGAVVSIRAKGDKICLWLRESNPRDIVMKIGHTLKVALNFDAQSQLFFEVHKDTMHRSSSTVKSKFVV